MKPLKMKPFKRYEENWKSGKVSRHETRANQYIVHVLIGTVQTFFYHDGKLIQFVNVCPYILFGQCILFIVFILFFNNHWNPNLSKENCSLIIDRCLGNLVSHLNPQLCKNHMSMRISCRKMTLSKAHGI